LRHPRLTRAVARFPRFAPPEKPQADGRPLQHTPSTRNARDDKCGEVRGPS